MREWESPSHSMCICRSIWVTLYFENSHKNLMVFTMRVLWGFVHSPYVSSDLMFFDLVYVYKYMAETIC